MLVKFCSTPSTVEKKEQSTGVSNSVRKEIVGVDATFCDDLLAKMLPKTDLVSKIVSKQLVLGGVFELLTSY